MIHVLLELLLLEVEPLELYCCVDIKLDQNPMEFRVPKLLIIIHIFMGDLWSVQSTLLSHNFFILAKLSNNILIQ